MQSNPKQLNFSVVAASCLVAATSIGAGVLALPITIAKIGIIPGIMMMIIMFFCIHISSLVNIEINLRAGTGLSLSSLSQKYSGRTLKIISDLSLMLLIYSLISAYLYAASSIINNYFDINSYAEVSTGFVAFISFILLACFSFVEKFNRVLFYILILIFIFIIAAVTYNIDFSITNIEYFSSYKLNDWTSAMPVLFTSFGFQVIFHTLTNYCNKNAIAIKNAFFYGSMLALVVYMLWTFSILYTIQAISPEFYQKMTNSDISLGEFILFLTKISNVKYTNEIFQLISFLAIITSIFGVSLGLIDIWKEKISRKNNLQLICTLLTTIPPYLVTLFIPDAFIKSLAFAGMILIIIAIFIPCYLFYKSYNGTYYYKLLSNKLLIAVLVFFGITIFSCEIWNSLK